jgi:hypothetical protein
MIRNGKPNCFEVGITGVTKILSKLFINEEYQLASGMGTRFVSWKELDRCNPIAMIG